MLPVEEELLVVEPVEENVDAGDGAEEEPVEGATGEWSSRLGIHSRPSMRLSSSTCLL